MYIFVWSQFQLVGDLINMAANIIIMSTSNEIIGNRVDLQL